MRYDSSGAFGDTDDYPDDKLASVVLFSREETPEGGTISILSVATPYTPDLLKARAVVIETRHGNGQVKWCCSRESLQSQACIHITLATSHLKKLTGQEGTNSGEKDAIIEGSGRAACIARAVSHLPILPPIWAALPEDPLLYHRQNADIPALIPFGTAARCSCGAIPNDLAKSTIHCTVYTLTQAVSALIEVQMCHQCSSGRRRYIGPDCRDLGLFNYNNRTLFSHLLFDEYTSAFSSSETPFVAWASVVSRRYKSVHASVPFVSENVFRTAWFLFSDLQALGGNMTCPECGPYPEDTIWDGVTLAFSRKQLLPSLRPPTTVSKDAPAHESTYVYKQMVIVEPEVRKMIRRFIEVPPGVEDREDEIITEAAEEWDADAETARLQSKREKLAAEAMELVELAPTVYDALTKLNAGLGTFFDAHFGLTAMHAKIRRTKVYTNLFIQIAAEESILQMMPLPAVLNLLRFCQSPSDATHSQLLEIPSLYNALKHEEASEGKYSAELMEVCNWLSARVTDVVSRLIHKGQPLEKPGVEMENIWQTSGCYYSMPPIRTRPSYPKLKHDQIHEGSKRGATCSKFYSQYGQQRLTGGIMCVWCTHSICYGFHCIPLGEGRNDVFSAIITHWPTAPKRVIYDFACALGPYCMTREPVFFADTQFVIDDFHASGHTKCSPAAFLKTYAQVDPRLARINTSAAECGNGGISRIRKSVSYMTQSRAIAFTRVFISIWNRLMIRKQRGLD
ncbi:hypothetical protein B0H19DRAFT_1196670 [Mycena capillaripes]|nr:hypothetical protein B0H19DRAFT_1196670 [Mycena capillaripes]